jgi:serine/threonine protein kinase
LLYQLIVVALAPDSSIIAGELASRDSLAGQPTTEFVKPTRLPRGTEPPPSQTFGKYMIYDRLGTGGMASVHEADLLGPGGFRRKVALKRLLPHIATDEEYVGLFLHEAKLAACLRHPNIATVYDFGQVDADYFMAMELVKGPSLKQLVKQCVDTVGLVPYPIVMHILIQILDALTYAHDLCDERGRSLGIIHRDVTPSNIVVGQGGIAKLIDFGVAKSITSHTNNGIIKGKLTYVAPEYVDGKLDRRVDLWSLGVVAWELLTNERLFACESDVETINRVQELEIQPPSTRNPDVPEELDQIVMTALQRNPDHRWQNATAMRNALADLARRLGNAPSHADVVEWIDWAFTMEPGHLPKRERLRSMTLLMMSPRASRPQFGAAVLQRAKRDRARTWVAVGLTALAAAGCAVGMALLT